MNIKARTIAPFCKNEKSNKLMIFGRIAYIKRYAPEQIENLLAGCGYCQQCIAEDENGNLYKIYTDYDAALVSCDAIAVPVPR